ncbi:MAG: hypothetical protein J3K34DRAFT_433904 [Monoraphidium minutum]|nr:MAG: hypothetical protein J3K34DRAFT_433904 [Monoraphidium minutum]
MPILELVISVISAAARLATGCGLLAPAGSAPRGDMHRQRHTSAPPSGAVAHIAWPGYGVLFFWQLGCMRYLQAHLGRELAGGASLTGSSAGALVCILAACGVDPHAALRRAAELADAAGVGPRPWGLAGVWGGLVRRWLSELLPEDAAPRCNAARVSVAVTRLPFLTSEAVSGFKDKADVIEATMASVHIPLFMDGRPWACCRGVRCIDGSFL